MPKLDKYIPDIERGWSPDGYITKYFTDSIYNDC